MAKILLVEDSRFNREMLTRRLKQEGYDVVQAVDGEQAIAAARTNAPDLILMDLYLPVLDGWEATSRLKIDEETKHIPVIVLTANTTDRDMEKALQAGCDDYDAKPVEMPRLLAKMQALLNRKKRN